MDAVTPRATGLNSRVAACVFSASKSCPAICSSFFVWSSVIHPSMAARPMFLSGVTRSNCSPRLALHHIEPVAGRAGFVHEDDAGGALLRADLVLVRPAAVVGHRLSAERLRVERAGVRRIRHRRIVDQHHERLALDVHALVVVPLIFGRDHAVAHEHQLRILQARRIRHVLRPCDDVVFPFQRLPAGALAEDERRRHRRDADERHLLDERAVGVARLEPGLRELAHQVVHRAAFAVGARGAAFELVRRQRPRVREHRGHVHVGQLREGRARGRRDRRRRLARARSGTQHGPAQNGVHGVLRHIRILARTSRHGRSLDHGHRVTEPQRHLRRSAGFGAAPRSGGCGAQRGTRRTENAFGPVRLVPFAPATRACSAGRPRRIPRGALSVTL